VLFEYYRKEGIKMPEITRFYGIVIKIYFNREHNPPHFHAIYGEKEGVIDIKSLEMIEGDLPKKAQDLIKEWGREHTNKIMKMWDTKILEKLPPLE